MVDPQFNCSTVRQFGQIVSLARGFLFILQSICTRLEAIAS